MKKVTSNDVAIAAGVSQSLVSLILNNVRGKKIKQETREHVFAVANDLGYRININARNLKSSKASAIGLLSEWDTNSLVFPPIINGLKSACFENDLELILCSDKKNSQGNYDFVDYFLQNRLDGLIYVAHVGVEREGIIEQLNKTGIPFVCIVGARDIEGVSCIDVNYIESGYMAVKHLVEQGYRRIAYILEEKYKQLNYAEIERLEGCSRAASESGAEVFYYEDMAGLCKGSIAIDIANKILDNQHFDSVISTSFKCYAVLKAAAKKRIDVPSQIGVISVDNELYAPYLFPALTTIDEPFVEMANEAVKMLLCIMSGNNECVKHEIKPVLTVRDSTVKNRT